ncbi:MAG TPA: substrate-binding domain-containing protein [Acidimicrobiales bacterium]|nr:substrate-binding domain-containing protein [Acidimicrobiales bacterium]
MARSILAGTLCVGALATVGGVTLGTLDAAPAAASSVTVTGAGSSYAAVAIDQWVAQVASIDGININYSTSSSVIGLNEFAAQQIDFGASEIGYSTNQANQTPTGSSIPYQYMPDVAGAECLMFNVTSQTSQQIQNLDLTPAVVEGIFSGTITSWNDPQLTALNPSALLPNEPINVVYREDASGDNYIFSDYLDTLEPSAFTAFESAVGSPSGPTAIWPIPGNGNRVGQYNLSAWIGQNGSDNSSNYVYGNEGTITYVETAYAILHHDPCAAIQNVSGAWVTPSRDADAEALINDQLAPDLEQNLTGVFESPQPTAYPISAYSYIVSEEGQMNAAKGLVLGQFVMYLACSGQNAAGELGYSPLPPNLVQDDFQAVARIAGNQGANAPPSQPTAANCKNPYVDGSIPLIGEPVVQGQATTTTTAPTGGTTATTAPSAGGGTSSGGGGGGSVTVVQGSSGAASGPVSAVGSTTHAAKGPTTAAAPGQIPGLALTAARDQLLGVPAPLLRSVLITALLVGLLCVPPLVAVVRRRRRRREEAVP